MASTETEFNFDTDRKYKIVDNILSFYTTRADNKYLKQSPNAYLESEFHYPLKENIRPDGGMDMVVRYRGADSREWLQDIHQQGELYPLTLTDFLGRPKEVDPAVDQWLTDIMEPLNYKHRLGVVIQLGNPSDDIKENASQTICVIGGYNDDVSGVYPWMQNRYKKYKTYHIDMNVSLNSLADSSSWPRLDKLQNGHKLINGGEGDCSDSDINVVIFDPLEYSLQIQFLQIKLFLKTIECNKYKNHCKDTAEATIAKMADRLGRWACPFFEESDRKESFFIPCNIKQKEFEYYLSLHEVDNSEWKRTKWTETISLEYNCSINVFGRSAIVQNIRPRNGRPYIVSNIGIVMTYSISKQMLKLECFVKRLNK